MTRIDYLLLAGSVLAGGYVVARLFVGWLRSSTSHGRGERGHEVDPVIVSEAELERAEKTTAPWQYRK